MSDPKIDPSFIASDRSREFKDILAIHSLAKQAQMVVHKIHSCTEGQQDRWEDLPHNEFQASPP